MARANCGAHLEDWVAAYYPDNDADPLAVAEGVTPVRVLCPSASQRSVSALKLLGRDGLGSILREDGQAELTCHFCRSVYPVEKQELQELLCDLAATA